MSTPTVRPETLSTGRAEENLRETGARVLVVDDEDVILLVLRSLLERHGCQVRTAESAESALGHAERWEPEVALVDLILPGKSGLELVAELRQLHPDTEVLVMTGNASPDTAVSAVRRGAAEYLQKPLVLPEVWSGIQRAIEKRGMARKNRALLQEHERRSQELSSSVTLVDVADESNDSDLLKEVLEDFVRILTGELDVERVSVMLVQGESGALQIAASHGLDTESMREATVSSRRGVSAFVAETGEPFLVTRADADGRLESPSYPGLGDSFLSVPITLDAPLQAERQILGVVNVTNRRSGEPMDERDLAYLRVLTSQLAAAIDGARRSQMLQRAYRSLKATQEQLVFSERIQAVGQMAAGVAHDFNNALSVILARAEFMADQLEKENPDLTSLGCDLQTIIKTCLQGAETVKRIQNYTRTRQDVQPSPVELNAVVREAVELSRPKWHGELEAQGVQIEIVLELGETPQVCGNAYELTQVVNNLIFNAVEAMPGGGRLSLRTAAVEERVRLEVSDSGEGMDETTRKRLFQPFFTTKENGQGLGTSIIYGIVTRHGGEIAVTTELGRGSTFIVTLPRYDPTDDEPEEERPTENRSDLAARILLVDDDQSVRETYEEALRIAGHQVVSCGSAQEALSIGRERPFDLLITDLSMAEMTGLELAAAIKVIDPSLPIILFSGWALQQRESHLAAAGIDRTLVKPCRIETLFAAVRETARLPDPE